MFKRQKKERLIGIAWLQGALLMATGAALWWIQQRRMKRHLPASERPVIYRRDIEMGPAALSRVETTPGLIDQVEGEVDREEQIQPLQDIIPDVQAGASMETEDQGGAAGPISMPGGEGVQTPAGDDLEIIEGIGPKINQLLQQSGIHTFSDLAGTSLERLEQILRDARLRLANPGTWPEQARLAAEGEWSKLEALQKTLKAGRKG